MENNKFGTNQLYGPQAFLGNTSSRSNHNNSFNQQQQQQQQLLLNQQQLFQQQYLYHNQNNQLQNPLLHHQQQHQYLQQIQPQLNQTEQLQQQLNQGKNNHSSPNNINTNDILIPRWLPKCGYCDKLILDEQCTEAEEKVWHLKCFKCFECKKTLGGQQYVMARPTVLRSNETTFNPESEYPYCLACFDAFFAELCEECGDIIGCEIGSIKHEGRHWHANEACFKCNFCKSALLGKLFLPANDGKIYCSAQCYQYILQMYRPSTTREKIQLQPPLQPPPQLPPPPPPLPPPQLPTSSPSPRLTSTTTVSSTSSSPLVKLPAQLPSLPLSNQPSPSAHHQSPPQYQSVSPLPLPNQQQQQLQLQQLQQQLQQQLLQQQNQQQSLNQSNQMVPISTNLVPQERTIIAREQSATTTSDQPSVLKPNSSSSPSSSSESTPLLTRSSNTLINDKPDILQNYLITPEEGNEKKDKNREEEGKKEKGIKEFIPSPSTSPPTTTTLIDSIVIQEKEILSCPLLPQSPIPIVAVSTNESHSATKTNNISTTQKIIPKVVTFDPSVKENESNRKCRSIRKVIREDDCCSTCSSQSSSSSDDEFDYDLLDARRRQWIAGTRIHYVAATAQPTTSTLTKTKNQPKSNDSNQPKVKTLPRPIKRFQDCSLNWAEILRSKLKGR